MVYKMWKTSQVSHVRHGESDPLEWRQVTMRCFEIWDCQRSWWPVHPHHSCVVRYQSDPCLKLLFVYPFFSNGSLLISRPPSRQVIIVACCSNHGLVHPLAYWMPWCCFCSCNNCTDNINQIRHKHILGWFRYINHHLRVKDGYGMD